MLDPAGGGASYLPPVELEPAHFRVAAPFNAAPFCQELHRRVLAHMGVPTAEDVMLTRQDPVTPNQHPIVRACVASVGGVV